MQDVASGRGEAFGRTYAEPLSGLRISWGSVLAGTVAMLAVSLILWALALALVSLATHPTGASMKGSVVALWICAIATTLIGAIVGGFLAGYLPGNALRGIGAAHAFIAWSVAFLLTFAFQLFVMRGLVNTAAAALAETFAVAPGAGGMAAPGAGPTPGQLTYAGRVALDYLVGASWTWFGTWFIAALLAVAAGAVGASRVRGGGLARKREERGERERTVTPLTPAPTP